MEVRRLSALRRVDSAAKHLSVSPHWPQVDTGLLLTNIRQNISRPTTINQGKSTNFCGYAAFTHIMLVYHPELYADVVLNLYQHGQAQLGSKRLKPSEAVRTVAGTFSGKGDLDERHADQLLFLTLADQFKGYLNFFDKHYQPGDENRIWAATNFRKFNHLLRQLGHVAVDAAGSDLIRPWKGNFYDYLREQQRQGLVMIYLNSKLLHPTRHSLFKLRAPTHFVVLYRLSKQEDLITFQYWDYGLRTVQLIPEKRFHKLIFGISTIKRPDETP